MEPNKKYSRNGRQCFMFPFTEAVLTQGENTGTHLGTCATDWASFTPGKRAPYYTPADIKCLATEPSYGQSEWQTLEPVELANGQVRTVTFWIAHDESFNAYPGMIVAQGEQLGNMGEKPKPPCDGVHCHIQFTTSDDIRWFVNKYGIWQFVHEAYIDDVCFVDDSNIRSPGGNWRKVGKPAPKPKPKPVENNVKAHGYDISEFNGDIDVRGQDFIIAKSSWGEFDDPYFKRNVEKCKKLGIPLGVYHFSYALNEAEARAEIEHFVEVTKDVNVEVGYWLDLEDNKWWRENNVINADHITMIARVFDEIMTKHGYYHGIYAGQEWFNKYIKYPCNKWIAQWGNDDAVRDDDLSDRCVLHQYTSNGNTLDEVVSYVDLSTFKSKPKEDNSSDLLDEIIENAQELKERLGD